MKRRQLRFHAKIKAIFMYSCYLQAFPLNGLKRMKLNSHKISFREVDKITFILASWLFYFFYLLTKYSSIQS